MSKPESVLEAAGPAYFILTKDGKRLYTCNSTGFVSAYSVADAGRSLTLLNKVPSEGGDLSYVSLDKTGKYIFAAISGDGRFVYGANRYAQGDGHLVVFAANPGVRRTATDPTHLVRRQYTATLTSTRRGGGYC